MRKIMQLCLAVSLVLCLNACGGSGEGEEGSAQDQDRTAQGRAIPGGWNEGADFEYNQGLKKPVNSGSDFEVRHPIGRPELNSGVGITETRSWGMQDEAAKRIEEIRAKAGMD